MKTAKTILFWFLIVIALIQFIPVDHTNKPVEESQNFVQVLGTPPKIEHLLKNACYDCHSNETIYPDYAFVAPLSWTIKGHVNEGREHLNFSEWAAYNSDLKKSILKNTIQDLEQNVMPLPAYIPYHPEANLAQSERRMLINYFQNLLVSKQY